MRFMGLAGLLSVCVLGAGCGPTIGDACTTDEQCGPGTCLNRDYTPGGACSLACTTSSTCPAGTVCVRDGIAHNQSGCFKSCRRQSDCRDGYICNIQRDSETPICVGPMGI